MMVESATNNDVVGGSSGPSVTGDEQCDDNHDTKSRWLQMAALCVATFGAGLMTIIAGTTFDQTAAFYQISSTVMSTALTIEQVVFLIGTFFCWLLIDRLDYDIVIATSLSVASVSTACAPLFLGFPGYLMSLAVRGMAFGFFYSSALLCFYDTLHNPRYRQATMQFQSAIHSLGNTVTPFLVRSFLVNVYSPSSPSPSDSSTLGINGSTISPPSAAERRDGATLECVSYAYVAVGLVALLTAVPAAAVYIYRGAPHPLLTTPRCRSIDSQRRRSGDLSATTHVDSRPDHNYQTSVAPSQSRRLTTFLFATLLFLIGLCFGANDLMPRSYVTSFVIRQLSWAADEASLLLAVFGASMTVGRLIGVPLIVHISPGRLLIGDVALTTTGLLALLVAGCRPSVPVAVVWIGVALIGLGMATVAVTVTLELFDGKCDNLIGLPAVSALINASSATGAATAATVAGYLLEAWTPLSVIYLTAASLAGLCVLLGVRQLVVRRLQETFVSTAAVVVVVEPSSDADDESLPLLRSSCNQRLLTTESG